MITGWKIEHRAALMNEVRSYSPGKQINCSELARKYKVTTNKGAVPSEYCKLDYCSF